MLLTFFVPIAPATATATASRRLRQRNSALGNGSLDVIELRLLQRNLVFAQHFGHLPRARSFWLVVCCISFTVFAAAKWFLLAA